MHTTSMYFATCLGLLLCLLFSQCTCPACGTFPEPLTLFYIDSTGVDLLSSGDINVTSIKSCTNDFIDYRVEEFIDEDSIPRTLVTISSLNLNCIEAACCANITLDNGSIDTLLYQINEIEDKCCTGYRTGLFQYNSDDLTGMRDNSYGAYNIIK